jgi:phenylpropionate dioxygenase-like ring-hydroxylating dioxygenase large terminal subunit
MSRMTKTSDKAALDQWYAVETSADLGNEIIRTRLLGQNIELFRDGRGLPDVAETLDDGQRGPALPFRERYGCVWTTLGEPEREIFDIPEAGEPDRRFVPCGWVKMRASGLRVVENFLDMAHFPFVHSGILGEEPKNEVCDYQVAPFGDGAGGTGVIATEYFFWQPQTNSLAHGGTMVEYTYRVVRPLTAILTKIPEAQGGFHEAISLHVQPVTQEASLVWILLAMTNFGQEEQQLREFQDRIFLQDKPIVESQVPKRLPLAPRAEMPIRSDRMSVAYRTYLRDLGLRYGAVAE